MPTTEVKTVRPGWEHLIGNKYAVNNDGGRPPHYKPEYVKKVDEYLAIQQDKYEVLRMQGVGNSTRQIVKLPTRKDFAKFIGHTYDNLTDWCKKFPEFSHALEKIDHAQEQRLLEKGLSGDYNSTIAKLVLSSNYGYTEKSENKTEITIQLQALENALRIFGQPQFR